MCHGKLEQHSVDDDYRKHFLHVRKGWELGQNGHRCLFAKYTFIGTFFILYIRDTHGETGFPM